MRPLGLENAEDVLEYLKKPVVNSFDIVLKDSGKRMGETVAHPESSQPDGAANFAKDTFSHLPEFARNVRRERRQHPGVLFQERSGNLLLFPGHTGDCGILKKIAKPGVEALTSIPGLF